MSAADKEAFHAALVGSDTGPTSSRTNMLDLVTSLDARDATATVPSDAQMIFEKIESSLGFEKFNALLQGAARRAAAGGLQALLEPLRLV